MSKILALLLVSLFLAFSTTVPFAAAQATPKWNIQTVDQFASDDVNYRIAVDSNGNPYIIYTSAAPVVPIVWGMGYAYWTGSNWHIETQAETYLTGNIKPCDLIMDSNNTPHLLYSTNNGLMLAQAYVDSPGPIWTSQTVDPNGVSGSVALDSTGNPHVAYEVNLPASETPQGNNDDASELKYASWNGSSWLAQTVDSPISNADGLYLTLDSNNMPHILYGYDNYDNQTLTSTSVKYATWNGTGWNIQTVFSAIAAYSNMVLDSNGYPHFTYEQNMSYYDNNGLWESGTIFYASWNGSSWITQTVVSQAKLGYLALDHYNFPQMDYYNNSLMYARWTGSAWSIQTVQSGAPVIDTSLQALVGPMAVDSNGNPHIIYYTEYPNGPYFWELNYATATEPPPILTSSPASTPSSTPSLTQSSQPTVSNLPLFIILTTGIIAVVVTLVYVFRKKGAP